MKNRHKDSIYFNTSHVVVYLGIADKSIQSDSDFDTSHVVVYLQAQAGAETAAEFQYISCCSLSHGQVIDAVQVY